MLRGSASTVKWALCIFCQDTNLKESVSSVATFKMSVQILALSKFDQEVHVFLAGVSDLIAAEGKYHPNCFKKFKRKASKNKDSSENIGLAMEWLVSEMKESAKKGHVLQLSEVWNRYCELALKTNIEVQASFRSRGATFKEKLLVYL